MVAELVDAMDSKSKSVRLQSWTPLENQKIDKNVSLFSLFEIISKINVNLNLYKNSIRIIKFLCIIYCVLYRRQKQN